MKRAVSRKTSIETCHIITNMVKLNKQYEIEKRCSRFGCAASISPKLRHYTATQKGGGFFAFREQILAADAK